MFDEYKMEKTSKWKGEMQAVGVCCGSGLHIERQKE